MLAILLYLLPDPVLAQTSPEIEPDIDQLKQGKTYIYKLDPEDSTGKGYKLVYIVTQTAYFDFFGATLWMNYPWYGGMRHYLNYTARWEQETITRLIDRYK